MGLSAFRPVDLAHRQQGITPRKVVLVTQDSFLTFCKVVSWSNIHSKSKVNRLKIVASDVPLMMIMKLGWNVGRAVMLMHKLKQFHFLSESIGKGGGWLLM